MLKGYNHKGEIYSKVLEISSTDVSVTHQVPITSTPLGNNIQNPSLTTPPDWILGEWVHS